MNIFVITECLYPVGPTFLVEAVVVAVEVGWRETDREATEETTTTTTRTTTTTMHSITTALLLLVALAALCSAQLQRGVGPDQQLQPCQ
ncbi:hypothetical protein CRUP_021765 [Coryphaenoides rupestris]|nr:hypothetical protein CRUP_021765 [Coryphaenoides rupestris]